MDFHARGSDGISRRVLSRRRARDADPDPVRNDERSSPMTTRFPFRPLFRSFARVLPSLLVAGCGHAADRPAQAYFSGAPLVLAQAIDRGDVVRTEALARRLGPPDLNRPGMQDMTPLFFALHRAMGEKPQYLEIVTVLVRAGADPLQQVPDLGSVLGVALRAESPRYMQALLDGGVNPDTILGTTPILFDVASEHTAATLKLLLDRGADVDRKDSLGNTALMRALTGMQLDQVLYLLDRGASPRFVNVNGVSFAGQLQFQIERQRADSPAQRRMLDIRDRIVVMGVAWPPVSREVERQRMRDRGQEPDKPLPVR